MSSPNRTITTSPSEAEVEAAARSFAETAGGHWRMYVRHARAALTAARKVADGDTP